MSQEEKTDNCDMTGQAGDAPVIDRRERAMELFKQGYNCSQAVVGAFEDKLDISHEQLMKLSSSFGGGMGRLREVCGAVSGMFMLCGMLCGYDVPNDIEIKKEHYARIQKLAEMFREKHGSIVCRNLLGLKEGENDSYEPTPRTISFYAKRPCIKIIGDAAALFEKMMENEGKV